MIPMTTDEKLTPAAQQIVPALRQKNRIERRSRSLTAMILAAVVVLFAGVVYLLAHAQASDEVDQQLRDQGRTRDSQIAGIQDQLKGVCKKVANPSQLTPAERDGCYRAENSIPPVPITVTQAPASGSGVTAQQVQSMIDLALSKLPRPLTVEQVTAAAQLVFAQNAASLTPGPEKLAAAVAMFCAQDRCRGPEGAKGDPAPAVTAEQIQQQVAAYCAAPGNNGCVGPPGPPPACSTTPTQCVGPQGISIVGFSDPGPTRPGPYLPGVTVDTDPCQITVTLIDPETTRTHTEPINVPVAFCYSAQTQSVKPARK